MQELYLLKNCDIIKKQEIREKRLDVRGLFCLLANDASKTKQFSNL